MPLGVEVLIDQETLRRIVLSSLDYLYITTAGPLFPSKITKLFPNSPGNYHNHSPTSEYDQETITIIGPTKIALK